MTHSTTKRDRFLAVFNRTEKPFQENLEMPNPQFLNNFINSNLSFIEYEFPQIPRDFLLNTLEITETPKESIKVLSELFGQKDTSYIPYAPSQSHFKEDFAELEKRYPMFNDDLLQVIEEDTCFEPSRTNKLANHIMKFVKNSKNMEETAEEICRLRNSFPYRKIPAILIALNNNQNILPEKILSDNLELFKLKFKPSIKVNQHGKKVLTIDMHSFSSEKVLQCIDYSIMLGKENRVDYYNFITGKGNHSKGNVSIIKPLTKNLAEQRNFYAHVLKTNEGIIQVEIKY